MSLVDQPLFAVPKGKAAKEVDRLHKRRRELLLRQREELQGRDRARAEHERLDEQVKTTEALALAHDKPADTKRDQARLAKLADEVADRDHRATTLAAAIATIEGEVRRVAQAAYPELLDEAIADYDQARYQIDAALASLDAAQSRARGAYAAAQSISANAGDMAVTRGLRDVPNVEQLVSDGGLGPLINDRDRIAA